MSLRTNTGIWTLALALLSGCPTPQQDGSVPDYRTQAVRTINGVGLNGIGLNGIGLNGIGLNGIGLNGIGLNGIGLNGTGLNDSSLNGTGLNGTGLNGTGLNGTGVTGLSLSSVTYNGTGLNGTGLNGTGLNGTGLNGIGLNGSELFIAVNAQTILRGATVVGTEFHYKYQAPGSSTAAQFTVRIDAASIDPNAKIPSGQTNDVWIYKLVVRQDGMTPPSEWSSLCYTEQGAPDTALLLSNRWDQTTGNRIDTPTFITFACRDFALGKCARMGYRPWAKSSSCTGSGSNRKCSDVALVDHHQSCVRMMRADYCGNGKSYTVNGTLIDIYDYLNPPIQVPETDWDIEARWTPTGAICINEPRHPELVGKWRRPDCNGDGKPDSFPACGQSDNRYSGKGLVVDRFDDDQSGCGK
ncbi:MAG TPA: ADYC domain-containing protein [Pseudomonadota bacterium]|nr:ADYC domain-containing protein [Pseudomonadota bacterium]